MGMPIVDNLDLEAVAAEAARRDRWEFLLTAGPPAVENGTGSPLNPLDRHHAGIMSGGILAKDRNRRRAGCRDR